MAEATLRAWERRYGIPVPARTSGGHRLYSEDDAGRIARIQRLVDQGWSVHAAARKVLHEAASSVDLDGVLSQLGECVEAFDAPRLNQLMDEAIAGSSGVDLIEHVFVPLLHRFTPSDDATTAAHRQFAVTSIGARSAQMLAERAGGTEGAVLVGTLGAAPDDLNGLFAAVALADAGWDIRWLGTAVSGAVLGAVSDVVKPVAVVVNGHDTPLVMKLFGDFQPNGAPAVLCVGHGFDGTDERLPKGYRVHRASFAQLPLALRTATS